MAIPTTEPLELSAGDTWQWRRELADYPAGVWSLSYVFTNATHAFSINATADGLSHAIAVPKAITAPFFAGDYTWAAFVNTATERHQVATGNLKLCPDLSIVAPRDGRSFARRLLDAVEAALENRASTDQLDVIEATFRERGVKRSQGTLLALRTQLSSEVRREENAAAGKSRNRLLVRFGRG